MKNTMGKIHNTLPSILCKQTKLKILCFYALILRQKNDIIYDVYYRLIGSSENYQEVYIVMKRIIALLLCLATVLCAFVACGNSMIGKEINGDSFVVSGDHTVTVVFTKTVIETGYCGGDYEYWYDSAGYLEKNLTYTLYADGEMVITGEGTMSEHRRPYAFPIPWIGYAERIKRVVSGDGVTDISYEAFCTESSNAYGGYEEGDENAPRYRQLTHMVIGKNVNRFAYSNLGRCDNLVSMEFRGNAPAIAANLFNNCDKLTIYCHDRTTGWTDSQYYDAQAGTWRGIPLVVLPALRA